jgi:hypothetical protein
VVLHVDITVVLRVAYPCVRHPSQLGGDELVCGQSLFSIFSPSFYPVVLHGCETWSLTLREEHILRELENKDLRT